MTTITPPSAPLVTPATPSAAPVVVVPSPPPSLARLAIGHQLEATVTRQTAKDVFQVQTPLGLISVKTAFVLPKGSALILQLQSQSPKVQFLISSLDGGPPKQAIKTGTAATLASGIAARSTVKESGHNQSATFAKLSPGNVLQATVLRPQSQAMTQKLSSSQAPAGTPSAALNTDKGATAPGAAKVSPVGKPGLANTAQPGGLRATAAESNPNAPKTASGSVSRAPGLLAAGSQLSVRVTAVQLPNPGATSIAATAPAGHTANPILGAGTSLSGTVTGSTPSGHPIVQTSAGVLALETQTVVPRGSVITLDVVSAPTPPLGKPGAQSSLHESLFTARRWPALEQVIEVLHEANPATAQQIVTAIIPRPDAGLTAGMIFFLSALRAGDLRSLLGEDPMRLIERSRPGLAGRVSEDFSTLVRMADEPGSGDWRVALIPINTGSQIEQIRLLLRQADGDDEDEDGVSDSRFIVDVELTSFGRLQLDGLVRNNGKSLDLIIRSEAPLSETMHNDIRAIFIDAADLTGLTGGVIFQSAPADFIDIPDPSSNHDLGLVV
jgi:hypothetical protein